MFAYFYGICAYFCIGFAVKEGYEQLVDKFRNLVEWPLRIGSKRLRNAPIVSIAVQ